MQKLLFFVVITVVGLFGLQLYSANPSEIVNPIYMESRIVMEVPNTSRKIEVMFLGEMTSQEDCMKRSDDYLPNPLKGCLGCAIKLTECKEEIQSRNKKLFSDQKINTTYLSLHKGSRFERNARMVVWGLNDAEARLLCNDVKNKVEQEYKGTATCI